MQREHIEMTAQEVRSVIIRMQGLLCKHPDLCEPEFEDLLVFADILRTAVIRAHQSIKRAA